jgi:acetyl esterase/lipase
MMSLRRRPISVDRDRRDLDVAAEANPVTRMTRRNFVALGGASSLVLSGGSSLLGCATTARPAKISFDPAIHVDPELRAIATGMLKAKIPPLSIQFLAADRKVSERLQVSAAQTPACVERLIPVSGAPDVRVYVINAGNAERPRGAVLYIHGGGFVLGSAKSQIRKLQARALELDCVIVAVEYRLAPETRFPGSLEDNYAAFKWLYDSAAELGVDPSRIAVMGESAGGGHAAMLAIAARDRGEARLAFQALIYPMLDDRTGSTRAVPQHVGVLVWTPDRNRFGWSALLGEPAGSRKVPYGSVPARVENLRGLPPTFIGVGSIDLFVREDIEYAERLIEVGVPTQLLVVPGAFHGFDGSAPQAMISRQFTAAVNSALKRALGT